MIHSVADERPSGKKKLFGIITVVVVGVLPFLAVDSQLIARLLSVVAVCLVLWLFELVPAFVPTLLLWALIPLTLNPLDARYSLATVLHWAADPVLALFFGGFVLGVAADRHGISKMIVDWALLRSGNRFTWMLALTMGLSAFMSMWISNIAAAALMFGALRPILLQMEFNSPHRRTLLVGTAFAANVGGIATPVGTGPNAIAVASVSQTVQIDFIHWMLFATPLAVGLLALAFALLWWRSWSELGSLSFDVSAMTQEREEVGTRRNGQRIFLVVLTLCVALWLSEPIHRISAAVVAIGAAASLFLFRNLTRVDLARIDWSTLFLIAGGITLGRLLESSGLVGIVSTELNLAHLSPTISIFILCLASALLSALMSNTATVVMLIPLATALVPEPSTAILVAVSSSLGMTFVISTPQNAMAHGEGGVHASDLLYPGLVIMIVGCALVALTGQAVLNLAGIP
jgi:solute carrier family 13 (sodium-dependent dicarboxylate transporter), member 2/3/5